MNRQQSEAELIGHLANQLRYLRTSGAAYDAGDQAEAMRLALTVRVLCHQTGNSRALLVQLGLLDKLKFVDTAVVRPLAEPSEEGLTFVTWRSPLAPIGAGGLIAQLDRAERSTPKPFAVWWDTAVMETPGEKLTRKAIVLALANKEGGAHVDPAINDAAYVAVSRDGSFGTMSYSTADGKTHEVDANPACAVMRQIGWEVDQTIASVFGE